MRVGLYSDHLYRDGQIGTGASKYIYYLTRELQALDIDVVPLHKGENPTEVDLLHDPHPPWNAPLLTRRPLVITIHDLAPATFPRYFGRWVRFLYIQRLRWFVRTARRILVPSQRTSDVVRSFLRPKGSIDIVEEGVEPHFKPLDVPTPERPFLVQVGVHRKIKDPWATLRAFESIVDQIPHDLHFVGERPPWLRRLEERVSGDLRLSRRVKFLWPGEDGLPTVYNQTSLVVHPCPEEGFGFVPLEALACGAHVLARASAVRETLGPHGCYFGDEGGYPEAILSCLKHPPPGTREERACHARSFTFRSMAERTLASYEAALGS